MNKTMMALSLTLLASTPRQAFADEKIADATLVIQQQIPVDVIAVQTPVVTPDTTHAAHVSAVADSLSNAADELALKAEEAEEAAKIHKMRMKVAAHECEESAGKIGDAAANLGSAAAEFASDAATLAAQTARLAKEKVAVAGNTVGSKAAAVGAYAERRAEVAAHHVATTAENVAEAATDFTAAASVSAVSQVVQAGNALVQCADKLLYPVVFGTLGYLTYTNKIKPHLPSLDRSMIEFEMRHPSVTTLREGSASLLTGGVLFASIYAFLAHPKVGSYLNRNMPNTAKLLTCVVNTECRLVNESVARI